MKKLLLFILACAPILGSAQPTVTITSSQTGCFVPPVTFTATVTGAVGTVTYDWIVSPDGLVWAPIAGATNSTYTVTGSTSYYFAVNVLDATNIMVSSGYLGTGTPPPNITNWNNAYCQGTGTISLVATGTNVLWYATPTSPGITTAPVVNLAIPGTFTWYVSQTVGGCISDLFPVSWNVVAPPPPSTVVTNSPVCIGDSMKLTYTPGCIGCSVYTTGPNGFGMNNPTIAIANAAASRTGKYYFRTNNMGCFSSLDSTMIIVGSCADSVWPGDANYDLITDNNDPLYIALYLNTNGYTRFNASTNYTPQKAVDWGVLGSTNMDLKHADCNGDGLIDLTDNNAVTLNYGLPHPKSQHIPKPKVTGVPDLYFDLTGISFTPGTMVSVPIKLGQAGSPMSNFFGIAAQIKVNGTSPAQPMSLTHTTSWVGNSSNTMDFQKAVSNTQLDIAYARNDHQNVNGSGTIGNVLISIPANASGQMELYFDNVTIIDNAGNVTTNYNVIDDTAQITVDIVNTMLPVYDARLVPNPSSTNTSLQLTLGSDADVFFIITDVAGRVIGNGVQKLNSGKQNIQLTTAQLPAGMYQVHVYTKQWPSGINLKFVKQ